MTLNRNLEAAWKYHDATKHSYASVHNNLHFLDWTNQPLPFKVYTALEPLALPREARQTGVAALSAIAESIRLGSSAVPDLEALDPRRMLSAIAERAATPVWRASRGNANGSSAV